MSQCPFSVRALNKLIMARKEGKIAESVKIEVHYIVSLVQSPTNQLANQPTGKLANRQNR